MTPPTTTKRLGREKQPVPIYLLPNGERVDAIQLVRRWLPLLETATRLPSHHDYADVFGRETAFRTHGQIAQAFGVAISTVRNDWTAAGMPGRPADGYPVAELLYWWVERKLRNKFG